MEVYFCFLGIKYNWNSGLSGLIQLQITKGKIKILRKSFTWLCWKGRKCSLSSGYRRVGLRCSLKVNLSAAGASCEGLDLPCSRLSCLSLHVSLSHLQNLSDNSCSVQRLNEEMVMHWYFSLEPLQMLLFPSKLLQSCSTPLLTINHKFPCWHFVWHSLLCRASYGGNCHL